MEKSIESGYVRLFTLISALQKNLECAKIDRVRELNLMNGEVFPMYTLYDHPEGLSAEELSHVCGHDRAFISRVVRSLYQKGFIEIPDIPTGKRRYGSKIRLTDRGREIGKILYDYSYELQTFINDGIPRGDLEIMYATLGKLRDRFEELNRITRLEIAQKELSPKNISTNSKE